MDFLKVSSALGHNAQAILTLQRQIDNLIAASAAGGIVRPKEFMKISKALRGCAEICDALSMVMDENVPVEVVGKNEADALDRRR